MSPPYILAATGQPFDDRDAAAIRPSQPEQALPRRYVPAHSLQPRGAALRSPGGPAESIEKLAATKDLLARPIKSQQRQSDLDRFRRNIRVSLIAMALVVPETARRSARLTATPEVLISGDSWVGEEALAVGLVDELCTIDPALAALGASHLRDFSPRASLIARLTEQISIRAADVLQNDAAPRPMTVP